MSPSFLPETNAPAQGAPHEPRRGAVRRLGPALLALAAAGAATLTARLLTSPAAPFSLQCPTHTLLGISCPLCGGTRALAAVSTGDLAGALRCNALVAAGVPIAVAVWVWWVVGAARGRPRRLAVPRWAGRALVVVAVAYTIVRNVAVMRGVLTA